MTAQGRLTPPLETPLSETASPETPPLEMPARLDRRLVGLLAVSVGLAVANLYYVQPLLPLLRAQFHVSSAVAGLAATGSQLGYLLGLAFLVPLGDLVERRRLVCVLSGACAVALVLTGLAPAFGLVLVGMVLVGVTAVVTQTLVPYAATLAPDHERGRVVGIVMSGLLLGILLARTLAGFLAGASSWRVVFYVAAAAMAVVGLALFRFLPPSRPTAGLRYRALLGSLVVLFREEPVLRRRCGFGALSMAAFSVLWTSIAFLLAGAPYHYGATRIGLFGLVGAAGALMATVAGRYSDRGRARQLTVVSGLCVLAAFVAILFGSHSLVALIVGIVVLDVGCQGMQITNQAEIYRLRPEARTRLNSVYMTCYFIGGTVASAVSAVVYGAVGWSGVSALGLGIGAALLFASLVSYRRAPIPVVA